MNTKNHKIEHFANLLALLKIFILVFVSFSLIELAQANDACFLGGPYKYKNITAKLGPGFGDQWNKYAWSMKFWKNYLYIGTNNVHIDISQISPDIIESIDPANPFGIFSKIKTESRGAQIWRYNILTKVWHQVTPPGINSSGFRKMTVMGDKLIISSSNLTMGNAELWYTTDGKYWQKMSGGPMGTPSNISFRSLAVYNGKLFVGSDNFTGAELWSWDGSSWLLVKKFTLLEAVGVSELAVLNDLLYVGTQVGGFSSVPAAFGVYTINSGGFMDNITPTGIVDGKDLSTLSNIGVSKLFPYHGKMFVGTANFVDGFTLMVYDPLVPEWKVITTNGFDVARNTYAWSMVEWDGKLLLGTFNSSFIDAYLNSNTNLLGNILGCPKPTSEAPFCCPEFGPLSHLRGAWCSSLRRE